MAWRVLAVKSRAGVLRNVVRQSTSHVSSDRVVSGSPHPACEKKVEMWKIIILQHGLEGAFELTGKWGVGSFRPNMAIVFHIGLILLIEESDTYRSCYMEPI